MNEIKDMVAIVTGAGSGIGAATALLFAEEGARAVVLADVNEKGAAETIEKIRAATECNAVFIRTDVADTEQIDRLFDQTLEKFGTLDILVNCAGICRVVPFLDSTDADWYRQLDINLSGTYHACKRALEIMRARRYGKIVNTASISGRIGGIRTSPGYVASKGAIISLTKSMAKDAAVWNVNVNAIAPGVIETEMTRLHEYHPEEIPMRRRGSARETANVILFLSSDRASYLEGVTIDVNGGSYMN